MHVCRALRHTLPLWLLWAVACGQSTSNVTPGSTVAKLTASDPNCPNGGHVLTYGVDKNGNGVLDADEAAGTFDICNGSNGIATLTAVVPVAAGTQCAQGGVSVQVGPDTNGNGVLDLSEVVSTEPICSAGGAITSVIGSLYINNSLDLAAAAGVETISGGLEINLGDMNGPVVLPNLISVQRGIYINHNGFNDFFLAKHGNLGGPAGFSDQPPTVFLSFPAMTVVHGDIYVDYELTAFSAPRLATVEGDFYCPDANAVLTHLTQVQSDLNCGTQLPALESVGRVFQAVGTATFPALQNVGTYQGIYDMGGGIFMQNANVGAIALPALTTLSQLQINPVYNPTASLSLPLLSAVGALYLRGNGNWDLAWHSPMMLDPPSYHDFNSISAPLLHTALGGVTLDSSMDSDYMDVLSNLHTVGGMLTVTNTQHAEVQADSLTHLGGLQVVSNSEMTNFSLSTMAEMTQGDPNYNPYGLNNFGDYSYMNYNCNDSTFCSSVVFISNPNLATVSLGNLSTIPGELLLLNLPKLKNLSAFHAVTSLGDAVYRIDNGVGLYNSSANHVSLAVSGTGVTTLSGLANLTQLPGILVVTHNPDLTSISDLPLMTGHSSNNCPVIYDNPKLPACQAINYLTQWDASCNQNYNSNSLQLLDPCSSNPCSGGTPVCSMDCSTPAGYTCSI